MWHSGLEQSSVLSSISSLLTVVSYRCTVYAKGMYRLNLPLTHSPSFQQLAAQRLPPYSWPSQPFNCLFTLFCSSFLPLRGNFGPPLVPVGIFFCFRIREETSWRLSFCPGVLTIGTSVFLSFSVVQIICWWILWRRSRLGFWVWWIKWNIFHMEYTIIIYYSYWQIEKKDYLKLALIFVLNLPINFWQFIFVTF